MLCIIHNVLNNATTDVIYLGLGQWVVIDWNVIDMSCLLGQGAGAHVLVIQTMQNKDY